MATSTNAQISYEAGRTLVGPVQMTDSGDHKTFSLTNKPWSKASGYEPLITPNGLVTGGAVIPAVAAGNNNVDVAALTGYLAGVLTSVGAATNTAATRGTTNGYRITSITVTSAGAIAAVAGTESTAFSETRGASGGPPLLPVGSFEVAQVRFTSITAAPVLASEIYQVVGQHQQRWDFPAFDVDSLAGTMTFASALSLMHTGPVTRQIWAKVYTPVYQAFSRSLDFVPIERTFSVTSKDYYGGTIASSSSALGQGSFTALLNDGHTDTFLASEGNNLIFKFQQDRNKTPYSLSQGILGITRTYVKTDQVTASCTISGEQKTVDFAS